MHGSYYVTNQSMRGSQYAAYTPTWERCWLQSFSVHPHNEDHEAFLVTKPYDVQMEQLLEEKNELGQIVSGHNMLV